MLKIDLHTHTFNSMCGHHTALEVMRLCHERGLEAIAITDHGPLGKPTSRGTFLDKRRFPGEYDVMRVLKGMEGNVLKLSGQTDIPLKNVEKMDIVLAGLHLVGFPPEDVDTNTESLVALARGPLMPDIITHPDQKQYPVDIDRLVTAAAENGVALELNDVSFFLGKSDVDALRRMVLLGHKRDALFALNSDGHTWIEFGHDEHVRQFLSDMSAPAINIINDWPLPNVLSHLETRKRARLEALRSAGSLPA